MDATSIKIGSILIQRTAGKGQENAIGHDDNVKWTNEVVKNADNNLHRQPK